jgi:hypothetical protein
MLRRVGFVRTDVSEEDIAQSLEWKEWECNGQRYQKVIIEKH